MRTIRVLSPVVESKVSQTASLRLPETLARLGRVLGVAQGVRRGGSAAARHAGAAWATITGRRAR